MLYEPEIWEETKNLLLLIIQAVSFDHSSSGKDCESACIKKPLPFILLLIQGSWFHPEKLFQTKAFPKLSTGKYVTQSSLSRLFFEGIHMPATDSPLLIN